MYVCIAYIPPLEFEASHCRTGKNLICAAVFLYCHKGRGFYIACPRVLFICGWAEVRLWGPLPKNLPGSFKSARSRFEPSVAALDTSSPSVTPLASLSQAPTPSHVLVRLYCTSVLKRIRGFHAANYPAAPANRNVTTVCGKS